MRELRLTHPDGSTDRIPLMTQKIPVRLRLPCGRGLVGMLLMRPSSFTKVKELSFEWGFILICFLRASFAV
jgi:hypothetical protein